MQPPRARAKAGRVRGTMPATLLGSRASIDVAGEFPSRTVRGRLRPNRLAATGGSPRTGERWGGLECALRTAALRRRGEGDQKASAQTSHVRDTLRFKSHPLAIAMREKRHRGAARDNTDDEDHPVGHLQCLHFAGSKRRCRANGRIASAKPGIGGASRAGRAPHARSTRGSARDHGVSNIRPRVESEAVSQRLTSTSARTVRPTGSRSDRPSPRCRRVAASPAEGSSDEALPVGRVDRARRGQARGGNARRRRTVVSHEKNFIRRTKGDP